MAITFFCSACGAQMRGPDHLAGSVVKCAACGSMTSAPWKPLPPEHDLAIPPPVARQQFIPQSVPTPGSIAVKHIRRHAVALQAFLVANFGHQRQRRLWNDRIVLACVGVNVVIVAGFLGYIASRRVESRSNRGSATIKLVAANEAVLRVPDVNSLPLRQGQPPIQGAVAESPSIGASNAEQEPDGSVTVYTTRAGAFYHREDCEDLGSGKVPMPRSEATRLQYGRCHICWTNPSRVEPRPSLLASSENTNQPDKTPSEPDSKRATQHEAGAALGNHPTQAATVYVTSTGSKYHRAGCRYLAKSSIATPLADPIASYGACSVCRPPQRESTSTAVASAGAQTTKRNPTEKSAKASDPPLAMSPSDLGTTPRGFQLHTGPRGGIYHYSKNGNKVYQRKKK
jgi:hypothetical protein